MQITIDEKGLKENLSLTQDFAPALGVRRLQCEILGDWCDAEEVEYQCFPEREMYIVRKNGKELRIVTHANRVEGTCTTIFVKEVMETNERGASSYEKDRG